MSGHKFLTADHPVVLAALEIGERGWVPLVLGSDAERRKVPIEAGWQRRGHQDREALLRYLTSTGGLIDGVGLGVRLGDGLADVDLDDPMARQVAPWLLPPTPAVSGRASSPRSHWWYRLQRDSGGQAEYAKHVRGDGATLLELRADRLHQTAVPPTVHPSGEAVRWEGEAWGGSDGPALVSAGDLRDAVDEVALVAALAGGWPKAGVRHDAYLALAGALLRARWSQRRVARVIDALARATGDEQARARVAEAVPSTAMKLLEPGSRVSGWPTLSGLVSDQDGIRVGRIVAGSYLEVDDEGTALYRDLTQWSAVDFRPPQVRPDLLRRVDGLGLLYRYRINYLYGPSEQGKSWLALAACVEVLDAGGSVMWLDLDQMDDELPLRLRMLGVRPEVFGNGQLRVAEVRDMAHVVDLLKEPPPDLVVMDGMTVLWSMAGGEGSNSPDVVAAMMMRVTAPWLRSRRTTVVLIDHTNKKKDLSEGPTGAITKMNTVRGTMIGVSADNRSRPLPGGKGHFSLWLYKEMKGVLRKDARARGAAEKQSLVGLGRFVLESTNPEDVEAPGSLRWEVLPPTAEGAHEERGEVVVVDGEHESVVAVPPGSLRDRVVEKVREVPDIHGLALVSELGCRKDDLYGERGLLSLLVKDEVLEAFPCGSGCTRCEARHHSKMHFRVR